MNMTTVLVCWLALGVSTIALALYRKLLTKSEDTNIHLASGGGAMIADQTALAEKLTAIDKWGKILTVITFAVGVVIGGVYVYQALLAVPI